MRRPPRNPLLIGALVAGLAHALGAAWCAGPCCEATQTATSRLTIGTASCCGADDTSPCAPSVDRADPAALSTAAAVSHALAAVPPAAQAIAAVAACSPMLAAAPSLPARSPSSASRPLRI